MSMDPLALIEKICSSDLMVGWKARSNLSLEMKTPDRKANTHLDMELMVRLRLEFTEVLLSRI